MGVVEDWVRSYNARDFDGVAACLDIERVVYVPDEHVAYAELIEHYRHDGEVRDTPEIIVFGLGADGLVHRMRLYLQRPGGQAPVGGRAAMGATPS